MKANKKSIIAALVTAAVLSTAGAGAYAAGMVPDSKHAALAQSKISAANSADNMT